MKNFIKILCLLIFTLISCEKKDESVVSEKYFDPQKIDLLQLENIAGFWDDMDTCIKVSDSHGFFMVNDTGFIKGHRYSGNEKGLVISVFDNKELAIAAMESRIQDVACIILPGGQKLNINEIWWYSDCIPNMVFVNQWNTIIEVYYYHVSFEEVEDILYATAIEIMQKVDDLSREII
jgi:hypothetical protein